VREFRRLSLHGGKMSPLRGYPIVAFIFPWADAG